MRGTKEKEGPSYFTVHTKFWFHHFFNDDREPKLPANYYNNGWANVCKKARIFFQTKRN